ncbi:MAG: DUF445 family protein [Candidatus Sericytochromatia bacterium]|nr:DUF445 family protein [Candidatus Tanganyikabacteria bacterium]
MDLTDILVVVFASAIAGRLVDFSAVWFLFHPYRKVNLPLIRELGVLPRRQEALADQVALLIEERLITRERISTYLESGDIADKVQASVRGVLHEVLTTAHPSVRDLLQRHLGEAVDVDAEIALLSERAAEALAGLLARPAFRARLTNLAEDLLRQWGPKTLEESLPPDLADRIIHHLSGRFLAWTDHADEEARRLDAWLASLGPLPELVPQEMLDLVQTRLKDRLPDLARILEDVLQEPRVKAFVRTYLVEVVDRLVASSPNMFSVEGLLGAWRQLFPEDFAKRLDQFVDETLPRLRRALEDPDTLTFVRDRIDRAFDEMRVTPVGAWYGRLGQRGRAECVTVVATLLRSPVALAIATELARLGVQRLMATPIEGFLPSSWREADPIGRRLAELEDVAVADWPEVLLPRLQELLGRGQAPDGLPEGLLAVAAHGEGPRLSAWLLDHLPEDPAARREVEAYAISLETGGISLAGQATPLRRAIDRACALADEPVARDTLRRWIARGIEALAGLPLGRPADWLEGPRAERLEELLVAQVRGLLRSQAHKIAETLDFKDMVRAGIMRAEPAAIEDVVKRRLARREFNTIFLIGLIFGGGVGLGATLLFRQVAIWSASAGWSAAAGVAVAGVGMVLVMLRFVRV